jgi:hypothetical protein
MYLHIRRYLAYVTRPHNWRISMAHGKIKPRWGKKSCLSQSCRKNLWLKVKNSKLSVTWKTYALYVQARSVSFGGEGDW